jgi:hypothetical protein
MSKPRTMTDSVPTQPESGPRAIMSYGTEHRTETPSPITPDFINKHLSETYIQRRSCESWDGPIHMSFNTRSARLRSFDGNWPHSKYVNLSPAAMAEGGFFTVVSMILLKWNLQKILYNIKLGLVYMILLKYIYFLQAVAMKSYAFIVEVH